MFLITINHLWTRARQQDIRTAGFGLKEIVIVDTPKSFPPMGFQLGALYLQRGWTGPVTLTDWTAAVDGETVIGQQKRQTQSWKKSARSTSAWTPSSPRSPSVKHLRTFFTTDYAD